jgi:hypothetical protein
MSNPTLFLSDNDAKIAVADTASTMRIMGFNEDTINRWLSRVNSWYSLEQMQKMLETYAISEDYYREDMEKELVK